MSADWLKAWADWLAAMDDHKPYVHKGLAHFESSQSSQTFKLIAFLHCLLVGHWKTFRLIAIFAFFHFENIQPSYYLLFFAIFAFWTFMPANQPASQPASQTSRLHRCPKGKNGKKGNSYKGFPFSKCKKGKNGNSFKGFWMSNNQTM